MARRQRLLDQPSDVQNGPVKVVRRGINDLTDTTKQVAMILARGDATRVEVLSPTEALIR